MTAEKCISTDEQHSDDSTCQSEILKKLESSISSLLWSNAHFTFTWTESVRLIIQGVLPPNGAPQSDLGSRNVGLSEKEKHDLEAAISILHDELAANKVVLKKLDSQRRQCLSKLLDLKGTIRVFCRMRPFLRSEEQETSAPLMNLDSESVIVKDLAGKTKVYNVDKVFPPAASQGEIFAEVEPIIRLALDGSNVCILAYGQTGTGKTFTMEGTSDCPGVVPHTIHRLFHQASLDAESHYMFTFSMLEVYKGELRDLLSPRTTILSIRMGDKGAIEIDNLREVELRNLAHANKLYIKGSRARATAWTKSNEASSRSHSLIRIRVTCPRKHNDLGEISKLWMVDLGGSERLVKTQATGETLEEGKQINRSLLALGNVISALQKKQSHVPYRDSKLTCILRDSLGEGSKALMVVHISPRADDLGETICSLDFAAKVRGVQLDQDLSSDVKAQKEAEMVALMQRLRYLEDDCESTRNNIRTGEFLIREKKKQLGKTDTSLDYLESEMSQDDQTTDTQSINSGNVAERSVGLPRYMKSTASSRIRSSLEIPDSKFYQQNRKTARTNQNRKNLRRASLSSQIDTSFDNGSIFSNNGSVGQSRCSSGLREKRSYTEQSSIDSCQSSLGFKSQINYANTKQKASNIKSKKQFVPCESEKPLGCNAPKYRRAPMKKGHDEDQLNKEIATNVADLVPEVDAQCPVDKIHVSESKEEAEMIDLNVIQINDNVHFEEHSEEANRFSECVHTPVHEVTVQNCGNFNILVSEMDSQCRLAKIHRPESKNEAKTSDPGYQFSSELSVAPNCRRAISFRENSIVIRDSDNLPLIESNDASSLLKLVSTATIQHPTEVQQTDHFSTEFDHHQTYYKSSKSSASASNVLSDKDIPRFEISSKVITTFWETATSESESKQALQEAPKTGVLNLIWSIMQIVCWVTMVWELGFEDDFYNGILQ